MNVPFFLKVTGKLDETGYISISGGWWLTSCLFQTSLFHPGISLETEENFFTVETDLDCCTEDSSF